MFSGIIETLGSVRRVERAGDGIRLSLGAPFSDLTLGESVCVSGVCLTVTGVGSGTFETDVSPETLRCSTLGDLQVGNTVNLERSLRIGDRLSGHLVFGHVDGVGLTISIDPEGDAALYRFEASSDVARYLVEKGSVAVDGVSLTVFHCQDGFFTVAVIPHTANVTTLGQLKPGARINLEADMVGKYVEKFVLAFGK